ncbi:MAG: hypothetical protein ACYTKD_13890 [Planctomycetota bacterium]
MTGPRAHAAVALAAFAVLAFAIGCGEKPPPAPPNRIDETMRTLGAEGLRLEGATAVIQLAPAGLTRSRFYRRLSDALGGSWGRGSSAPPHEALRERYGIDLSGVEAVVFTVDPERNAFVLAAATRAPVERDAWLAALPRMRGGGVLERFDTYGGVELYAPPREYAGAVAFPGPQIVAAGSTPELMQGIDAANSGAAVPYLPRIGRLLEAAPARAGTIVAAVPTPKLMEELSAAAGGPSFAKVSEKAEGILVAATARETLEIEVRMFMRAPADAAAAREEARAALRDLERTLGKAGRLEEARPLVRLVDDVRVGGTGAVVEISVTIPPGVIAPLVGLATSGKE